VHADEAALSHIVNSLLWRSVENELSRESWCDGKSSIKRAATMLAPEGDQRSLSDFQIVEARLVEGASYLAQAITREPSRAAATLRKRCAAHTLA
jgi:hypothetical protein